MKMLRLKYTVAKLQGTATVDGQVVAEATLMCKLVDKSMDQSTDKTSDKSVDPGSSDAPNP